eukprot:TRINITY_DN2524_c0_g1_i1.p1 TRINITY_DN2524_c0_g1~~TRINITY_DN2524_c0_g1_i1.p1  ORF type:complete len:1045 (+),score=62.94 TRINITY_DN2524_c0_g1_i1:73-3135(+)
MKIKGVIFILSILLLISPPARSAFSAISPTSCSSIEYYNLTLYECNECGIPNAIKSSDGISCACDPNYIPTYSLNQLTECTKCPNGGIYLPYRSSCSGIDTARVKFNSSVGDYLCLSSNEHLLVNQDYSLSCQACSKFTYAVNDQASYGCFSCNHPRQRYQLVNGKYDCYCSGDSEFDDLSGTDTCGPSGLVKSFNSEFQSKSYSIVLDSIDNSGDVTGQSVVVPLQKLDPTFKKAWFGCQYSRTAADCQTLSNLCVLAYYDKSNPACSAYLSVANSLPSTNNFDSGWKEGIPWLYYNTQGKAVSESDRLKTKYAIDSTTNPTSIELWVAKYSMNGTFLGYSSFDNEGFLCHVQSILDIEDFKKIGHNYINKCDYDLSQVLNVTETVFYELFIRSTTDSGAVTLIDVPTRVLNYDDSTEKDDYKYVRRFFVYDNICTDKSSDPKNSYIRWAYSMTLRVQLKEDAKDEIYVPTLTIEYRERSVEYVANGDGVVESKFTVVYFKDFSGILIKAMIALIVISVCALLISVYRIYVWWQANPASPVDLSLGSYKLYAIWSSIYLICHTWAVLFFWYLFGISAYYYLFFKLTSRPSIFLPDPTDYSAGYMQFDAVFGTLLALQVLCVVLKIVAQSSYDIFFIDWETPKLEERQGKQVYKVNAWREVFVANEVCEAMCEGTISVTLNYVVFIFFLFGLGWQWWNLERPGPTDYKTINPENPYLNFFVEALVFWITALVDYLLKWMVSTWIPPHSQDVVDLMSVSNISLIIFEDLLRGYYIHGRAPAGKADANAEELKKILDGEVGNVVTRLRGLDPKDNTEVQTFEIYPSVRVRQRYNELMAGELKEVRVSQQEKADVNDEDKMLQHISSNESSEVDRKKENLNTFFKEYITTAEQPKDNQKIAIEEKTYLQMFFGIKPTGLFEQANQANSIFLKDPRLNFKELSGAGLDFHMCFLRVLMFWFWDRVLYNKFYAVVFTYLIEKFIWWIREIFVVRNVSNKSLVDDRFLSQFNLNVIEYVICTKLLL